MGYRVDFDKMNDILAAWSEEYHIFAPAWDQRKKKVRYREIKTIDQIVLDRQSDFSPKEAYYPVSQTMFYFTDTEVTESELADDKGILILHVHVILTEWRVWTAFLWKTAVTRIIFTPDCGKK